MTVALEEHPLSSIVPEGRPYLQLAVFYAEAARPDLARAIVAEYEASVDPGLRGPDAAFHRHWALGSIALAEGRREEGIEEYRLMEAAPSSIGWAGAIAGLGRAYDLAGQLNSAIVAYERYLQMPAYFRPPEDAYSRSLPDIYRRLGHLYEARGRIDEAIRYYGDFIDLWADADPELQPQVVAVRKTLERLQAGTLDQPGTS